MIESDSAENPETAFVLNSESKMKTLQDTVLEQGLVSFFSKNLSVYDELSKIINPIQGKKRSLPSLRVLEHVVTNMARQNRGQGFFSTNENGERIYVDIHALYKTTLGTYGKRRFDSFRRTSAITFKIDGREEPIKSSFAQLCFGRFIYQKKIMQFIKESDDLIRQDMAAQLKKNRKRKLDGLPRPSKKKKMFPHQVYMGNIVLSFK